MGHSQINLLEYLRSKTQVDLDTFDVTLSKEFGKCVDCTSNQYEYYTELAKPTRKDILLKAIETAKKLRGLFPEVTFEELAVEVGAVYLALAMLPDISGNLHVMANPNFSYSKKKIVDTGKRIHELFKIADPFCDDTRFVMKVAATWEGLQACRELRNLGIKTLGTTLFCMEQAVLAGQAGCVSISPFVRELKEMIDPSFVDPNPQLDLSVEAQKWYRAEGLPTKVKACATTGLDEILMLAGVDAQTLMPADLHGLQSRNQSETEIAAMSLFKATADTRMAEVKYPSYIDNEEKYRMDFGYADEGNAQRKLGQAIHIFCDFQAKAEEVVRNAQAS
ncbi:aldolase [Aspergillus keveii]|uniref:Aldolase n=1 Tax=Aspergillus keveii TaxID=714993 RepID=A0ABR4FN77_9EURO